jgi:DNA recombination protein RmuC
MPSGDVVMDQALLGLLALNLIAVAALWWRGRGTTAMGGSLSKQVAESEQRLTSAVRDSAQATGQAQTDLGMKLAGEIKTMRGETQTAIADRFQAAQTKITESLAGLQSTVQTKLDQVRDDNEKKLDKIRGTVEEKLQTALEKRLGESFRTVSERLEQVHRGLGDMQKLATGVGDLKRVLTNVRSRGVFGEVQLGALLEQVMAPSQYETNVATVPGSGERVEFAVKLPGRDDSGSVVFLPIDAKFPQEDYLRLLQAHDNGDAAAVEEARRGIRQRMLAEGEKIRVKYIAPPHTTDFALMFLPTEGLYAEALRIPGLSEELQTKHRVVLAGPTTLTALLNSLQMGFRTLAIEKRSSEVWKVLGAVKTEFAKFGGALDAVKRKLGEASDKIDATGVRTRRMERELRDVEKLPEAESQAILPQADPLEAEIETEPAQETVKATDLF